jgi:hypothetical protein
MLAYLTPVCGAIGPAEINEKDRDSELKLRALYRQYEPLLQGSPAA